jgi:hypothetical protein
LDICCISLAVYYPDLVFQEIVAMTELRVTSALRAKRAELAGTVIRLDGR